jgi:hypothetical protein
VRRFFVDMPPNNALQPRRTRGLRSPACAAEHEHWASQHVGE